MLTCTGRHYSRCQLSSKSFSESSCPLCTNCASAHQIGLPEKKSSIHPRSACHWLKKKCIAAKNAFPDTVCTRVARSSSS
uniref:Uncharacterized protein n=1 Tax=Oryza glaberrima TaxID=4538 RepID=I1NXW3_ORYGL